jgi:hypothetical protein
MQNGLTRKERKQLTKEREEVMMELDRARSYELEGPLEVFLSHRDDVYALENKLDSIDFRLGDSIDLDRNIRCRQILRRIDSLNYLIDNYVPPCVYGPPERMEQYNYEVNNKLDDYQRALEKAQKELEDFDRMQTEGPEIYELLYGGPDLYTEPRIDPIKKEDK